MTNIPTIQQKLECPGCQGTDHLTFLDSTDPVKVNSRRIVLGLSCTDCGMDTQIWFEATGQQPWPDPSLVFVSSRYRDKDVSP